MRAKPDGPRVRLVGAAMGILFIATLVSPSLAAAADVPVGNSAELIAAVEGASPGDVITLAAGVYPVGQNINASANGAADARIVVRAETLGEATIQFDAVEGFKLSGAYWTFENLEIEGVCGNHSDCEHAWHIFGDAEFAEIRGNKAYNFNAHIKSNGSGSPRVWPDDVRVEQNEFFSTAPRQTSNPVTPIDVVGGRRWLIKQNHIHDFEKAAGNTVSYAAFLKGGSRDGTFERNLIECESLHAGGVRLGISFGGGGSSPDNICEEGTCNPEHQGGVMKNNIIANCPADVGIYVNEGQNVRIFNNTLFNTSGIDIRFATSSAELRNNVLDGRIRTRDGGSTSGAPNLEQVNLAGIFADPAALDFGLDDGASVVDQGQVVAEVDDDFCGNPRSDGANDIGAIEYGGVACDASTPFRSGTTTNPNVDMGSAGPDVGPGMDDVGRRPPGLDAGPGADGGVNLPDAQVSPNDDGEVPLQSGGSADGGCGCGVAPTKDFGAGFVFVALFVGLRRRR